MNEKELKQTDDRRRKPPARLLFIALLVSLGTSFHFGFQLTLTNPCQTAFIQFLNGSVQEHFDTVLPQNKLEALWSCIVAVLFVGALFGALFIRCSVEKLGRKYGLVLAFTLSLISFGLAILSYFINSFELYFASRICMGFAISLSVGMAGIFLTECSPKECRGSVSMTMGVMMQCGTVAGSVIGMPQVLGRPNTWWLIYVVEATPLLFVIIIFLPVIHETPSFLLAQGREMAARHAIRFYYSLTRADTIEVVLIELRSSVLQHKKSLGMLDVWREKGYTRHSTLVGCVISLALVFSGTAVIAAYAVEIFRNSGLTITQASIANVGLSTVSVISCIIAAFIVDRFGRRRLVLTMYSAMLVVNILIFGLLFVYEHYHYDWTAKCLIGMFCAFLLFFAMGPGPLAFFITSEMMSQSTRSAGQSWMYLVQMTCRALSVAIFLPLQNWLGASWSYLILFIAPVIFAIAFFYFQLPETKNRNIAEVQLEFEQLPRLRSTLASVFATTTTFRLNNKTADTNKDVPATFAQPH